MSGDWRMGLLVLLAAVMAAVLSPRRALAYDYCQPASVVAIREWIKRQHGTVPEVTKWEPNCRTKNVNENQTDSKIDKRSGGALSRRDAGADQGYLKRQMKPDQGFSACAIPICRAVPSTTPPAPVRAGITASTSAAWCAPGRLPGRHRGDDAGHGARHQYRQAGREGRSRSTDKNNNTVMRC